MNKSINSEELDIFLKVDYPTLIISEINLILSKLRIFSN